MYVILAVIIAAAVMEGAGDGIGVPSISPMQEALLEELERVLS
jgi:hypothetical protein